MSRPEQLVGERVAAASPDGRERLAGVLLPPVLVGPPRLHADDGQVVDVGEPWLLALVDRLPKGSRRRTHCPEGRPLYRYDDLPAVQLATETMLRRARRRVGEGQQPIASYLVTGTSDYAPLYAVVDSPELPPLSPKRQATRDRARTCARCGVKRTHPSDPPFPRGHGRERYCQDCQEPGAAASWMAQRAAGRTRAAEWAQDVLTAARANPERVALIHVGYPNMAYIPISAETWDGQVLLDTKVSHAPRYWQEDYSRPADVVEQVRALQGLRLISWRDDQRWLERLLQELQGAGGGDISLTLAEHDGAGPHWDQWRAERPSGMNPTFGYALHQGQVLRRQEPPSWHPPVLLDHVREVVAVMASGRSYWWWATCQDCDEFAHWFGTAAARDPWSERHHADTGHVISHTTEPGTNPAP